MTQPVSRTPVVDLAVFTALVLKQREGRSVVDARILIEAIAEAKRARN
jgi:hypothetical protein